MKTSEIDLDHLAALLALARKEDLGQAGDLTSQLLPETWYTATGAWTITTRDEGRFCGAATLPSILKELAPEVQSDWIMPGADGACVKRGDVIARLSGRVCQMLAAERIMLNLLQHLSGVATLTSQYVHAVAGTHAKILDTRKTMPGMRSLEKYAVQCGGGHSHRMGLYDAILIKDNHLAGVPVSRLAHVVFEMLNRVPTLPSTPAFVEVEVDSLAQFAELLKVVGVDVILLDNFAAAELRTAVQMRNEAGLKGKIELEASGGIDLESVRKIAETGVDRIAVGAITHSAPILDIGLDAAEN